MWIPLKLLKDFSENEAYIRQCVFIILPGFDKFPQPKILTPQDQRNVRLYKNHLFRNKKIKPE